MFKLDLEKAKEPVIKLPTSVRSSKKEEFQKNIYIFINYAKAFDCVDHNQLENSSRDGTWSASWEIRIQVKKQQLEKTRNNRLIPNQERSTSSLYIVTLLI